MKATEHLTKWVRGELKKRHGRERTQAGLATAINVTEATVSRILNGINQQLDSDTVDGLCEWGGVSEYALLAISRGEPDPTESASVGIVQNSSSPGVDELVRIYDEMSPQDRAWMIDTALRIKGRA